MRSGTLPPILRVRQGIGRSLRPMRSTTFSWLSLLHGRIDKAVVALRVPGAQSAHATAWSGHIPGTSRRDLLRNDENHRDLSRRSDRMRGAFAPVREMLAQDPADSLTQHGIAALIAAATGYPGTGKYYTSWPMERRQSSSMRWSCTAVAAATARVA